ncbi:MAG: class I SAM-dependent methyltransferase [Chloroflexi bacterium]|nr:class I SAM-dependent methyltransferase [Chloroflexota bacterium]
MNKETRLTVEVYSASVSSEWDRLTSDPYHRLEFDTTMRFLKKHLPKKGLILDAGGGPGRYTVELAKRGYDVVLLDLVQEHLDFAEKQIIKNKLGKRVKNIVRGSITDLSDFKDNSFDAVLCLGGPLSHIHPEQERKKAVSELIRVGKGGSVIFVSVMSRYGVLAATPAGWPHEAASRKDLEKLVFKGEDYRWRGSGYCHFFTCNELEQIFLSENVDIMEKAGLEGLNIDMDTTNKFAKDHPEAWKNWLDVHYKICTEQFVVDASGHMLIIVRKK